MRKSNRGRKAVVGAACAAVGLVVGFANRAQATAYTWNTVNGGNWSDSSWTNPGYPNAAGDTATISQNITADRTLTIDVPDATISALTFGDSTGPTFNNWTIASSGGNVLTTNNNSSSASITSNNGNNTISAQIALSTAAPTVSLLTTTANGTVFGVNGGTLALSGGFSNTAGGYSVNSGLVIVSGTALNTGDIITRSELRIAGANSLGSGNLDIIGGDFQSSDSVLGVSGFTRSYGLAAGQFQFGASGSGFSAFGGNLTLNIGGSAADFDWATVVGSGNKINFGSATANGTVNWKNNVLLTSAGSGNQTQFLAVLVGVGSSPEVDVQGIIKETGLNVGSVYIGPGAASSAYYGTVVFSGANTYTGTTTIACGTLRINNANALSSGNLILGVLQAGTRGVLESNDSFGAFTRSLGTGNNQVQFGTRANDTTGGFSAYGGNFTINIGGNTNPSTLNWGTAPFIGSVSGQQLVFGSRLADSTVLWKNPISFGSAATFTVIKGVGTTPEVDMQGVLSGVNGLTKSGTGTLLLSAANTYTGATNIGSGTGVVQLGNALALQSSAVSVGNTNGITFSSGIGTFTLGGLGGAANIALTDASTSPVALVVGNNSASNTSYTGVLSGTGASLTKVGAGTLTLTGGNLYSSATAVNNGTLLEDFSSSSVTTNILYNGITPSGLALGGGTLSLKGKSTTINSQTFGNVTVNAGASTILLTPNSATSLTLTLGNTWTRNNQGTLTINTSAAGTKAVTSSPITGAAQSATSTILPYTNVIDGAGNNGWATVDGSGNIVRYTLYNTTLPTSGTASNTNYSMNGTTVTLAATEAVNSLLIQGTGASTPTINLNGKTLTFTSGGLLTTGNTTNITINGTGQLGANDAELIVQVTGAAGQTVTIGSTATIGGATSSLTKAGAQTMLINSANTYTGGTAINAGTLRLGNANAVQNSPVAVWGGALSFAGSIGSFKTGGLLGSGNVALTDIASAAVSLELAGASNGDYTYSGVLSGTVGSVTKSTAGKQTLSGTNTYTGGTTVSGGTLVADNNAALGTGSALATGGTLEIATGRTVTNNLTLNGAGATLRVNGSTSTGTLALTAGTISGSGTINQAVTLGSGLTIAPGNGVGLLTVNNNFSLGAGNFNVRLDKTTTSQITTPSQQSISGVQQYDRLAVTGTASVAGGTLVLEFGQKLVANDVYYILDNQSAGSTGVFASATINGAAATGSLADGGTFSAGAFSFLIKYTDTVSGPANDISLTAIAVPEPTTAGLLGLAGMGLLRRRRRVGTN